MTTIKEDYVSFEVAKLLKEKGFDAANCQNSPHFAYNRDGRFSGPSWDTEYHAPTLQMAMKWLREKGIYMSIDTVISSNANVYFNIDTYSKDSGWNHPVDFYDSYEEACEAAIKYCLENLI